MLVAVITMEKKMSDFRTHFVFDAETGYILSGFDCLSDIDDGFNIYTRPYSHHEFHPKDEKCRMDYIYHQSKRSGLPKLKYDDLRVGIVEHPNLLKQKFVKNPRYLFDSEAVSGWWQICDMSVVTVI